MDRETAMMKLPEQGELIPVSIDFVEYFMNKHSVYANETGEYDVEFNDENDSWVLTRDRDNRKIIFYV